MCTRHTDREVNEIALRTHGDIDGLVQWVKWVQWVTAGDHVEHGRTQSWAQILGGTEGTCPLLLLKNIKSPPPPPQNKLMVPHLWMCGSVKLVNKYSEKGFIKIYIF